MRYLIALLLLGLSLSASAASGITQVKAVIYPAWIDAPQGKIPLTPGARIPADSTLASGDDTRLLLELPDGSELKLGQNVRFRLDRAEHGQNAAHGQMEIAMTLLTGKLRYATSTLAKLTTQRKVDVKLASATIGIRGTDYWAMVDDTHEAVCLFEGKVDVAHPEQGVVPLEQPTAFWVRYFNKPPQAPGNATAEELKKFLGWVEMVPGSGVAVEKGRWRVVAGAESNAADAQALNNALRNAGYPSQVIKSYGLFEVRIEHLATRADGEALLKKLSTQSGLSGKNTKVVATR